MSEETRRRWRRRLLLAGLLPLLLAVGFAAKVAVMLALVEAGRSSYADGAYADARGRFAFNSTLNVLEPWVTLYDEGTARYRLDDFPGAVRLLTEALTTVPPTDECRVRINLALSHESLGDGAVADGNREIARAAWRTATDVLREGGCLSLAASVDDPDDPDDPDALKESEDPEDTARTPARSGAISADQQRDARVVDRRLRDKRRADSGAAALKDDADDATAAEAAARAARLERRNEQAQQQRLRDAQRKEDREADREREQPPPQGSDETDEDREPRVYEW